MKLVLTGISRLAYSERVASCSSATWFSPGCNKQPGSHIEQLDPADVAGCQETMNLSSNLRLQQPYAIKKQTPSHHDLCTLDTRFHPSVYLQAPLSSKPRKQQQPQQHSGLEDGWQRQKQREPHAADRPGGGKEGASEEGDAQQQLQQGRKGKGRHTRPAVPSHLERLAKKKQAELEKERLEKEEVRRCCCCAAPWNGLATQHVMRRRGMVLRHSVLRAHIDSFSPDMHDEPQAACCQTAYLWHCSFCQCPSDAMVMLPARAIACCVVPQTTLPPSCQPPCSVSRQPSSGKSCWSKGRCVYMLHACVCVIACTHAASMRSRACTCKCLGLYVGAQSLNACNHGLFTQA